MEQLILEIQKMQQGNFQDYESFYNLSAGQIYAQIKALVPDDETAQQVLTDTYNQIYADIGGLNNPEAFFDWAAQIVQAKAEKYAKKGNAPQGVPMQNVGNAPQGAPMQNTPAQNVGNVPIQNMPMQNAGNAPMQNVNMQGAGNVPVKAGRGAGKKIGIAVLIIAIIGGIVAAVLLHGKDSDNEDKATKSDAPGKTTEVTTEEITTELTTATTEATTEVTTEATTEEMTTEVTTEEVYEAVNYKKAYADIIMSKKYECLSYNWQMGYNYELDGVSYAAPEGRPIAFYDVTGDDIPELFLCYCSEYGSSLSLLDIYTVNKDGNVVLMYSVIVDYEDLGGSEFMIFTTHDGRVFFEIGNSDDSMWFTYYELRVSGDAISEEEIMYEAHYPNEDYSDWSREYRLAGNAVGEDEYTNAKKEILQNIDAVIQYNWTYVDYAAELSSGTYNMSWSDAYKYMMEGEPTADNPLPIGNDLYMYFSSGAGGWQTDIVLCPNGDFSGVYYDTNFGESGDGYDSTTYICKFTGKFKDIKKVNEYTYQMTLDRYDTEKTVGEEWIEKDLSTELHMRYVAADPYGIYGGDTFEFYVPGIAVKELPEEYVGWIYGLSEKEKLDCYGLYNVNSQCGFGY